MSHKSNKDPYKFQRRDWGGINPTTKVYKDKNKYSRKIKHKGKELEK